MLSLLRPSSRFSSRTLSRASLSFQSRHGISTRPTRLSLQEPLKPACRSTSKGILQYVRWNSTTPSSEEAKKGVAAALKNILAGKAEVPVETEDKGEQLSEEEAEAVAKQIKEYMDGLLAMWPRIESPSPDWSSEWENWHQAASYFAPSPYFLNLPQIEMLVNIHYGLDGFIVPVLYSNEQNAFIFVLQDDRESSSVFLLYDQSTNELYALDGFQPEDLAKLMNEHGSKVSDLPKEVLEADLQGQTVVQGIVTSDERVLPMVDYFLPVSLLERGSISEDKDKEIEPMRQAFVEMMEDAENGVEGEEGQEGQEDVGTVTEQLQATSENLNKLLDDALAGELTKEERDEFTRMKQELEKVAEIRQEITQDIKRGQE